MSGRYCKQKKSKSLLCTLCPSPNFYSSMKPTTLCGPLMLMGQLVHGISFVH